MTPKARESHVLFHQVEDETVVYDQKRKWAHRLNKTAAKVWRRLDGESTSSEIASDLDIDEDVVNLAIDDLASAQLLESSEPLSVSRRSALRRVASAATIGFLLPVVTSIAAPSAAEAASGDSWGHGGKSGKSGKSGRGGRGRGGRGRGGRGRGGRHG